MDEQWLYEGDCEKCRKQKYCTKPCTQNKRALRRKRSEFRDKLLRQAGIPGEIVNKMHEFDSLQRFM